MFNQYAYGAGLLALLLSTASFGGVADSGENTVPAQHVEGVNGLLLHRINVSPDHRIEFFQFEGGQTGTRETLSIDSGESSLLDPVTRENHAQSLADIFRRVAPHQTVPQALLNADRKAAMLTLNSKSSQDAALVDADGGKTSALVSAQIPTSHTLAASAASAAQSCSDDYYGDGWGATWFKQNYCNTGAHRLCDPSNWGWGTTTVKNTQWWSYRQMEGDFNIAGHATVTYALCPLIGSCKHATLADTDVAPRHVSIWTLTGGFDRVTSSGTSPCGHLDMATLYTRSDEFNFD